MANIKSQIKRNRQNEQRRLRNRDYRGAARTAVKGARTSLDGGQDTAAAVTAAISALDIAAQKGAIHPRNAARRKGRLMHRLAALGLQVKRAPAPAVTPVMEGEGAAAAPSKKPAKAEKEPKPAREEKPRAESKKSAAKPAEKKTAEKKPAVRKSSAKK